jgi:carboxymethylenebutenolidase
VLQPNVFYRTGRPPIFDFPFVFGEERSMKRFAELANALSPDAQERDGLAYAAALAKQPSVTSRAIGVVGHCFTGAMALRIAAACPERVRAAASLHGAGLFTGAPQSPHLVLPRVRAELYIGHASQDVMMPEDAIQSLETALAAWGGAYESETYAGAQHGWTVSDSPTYDAALAAIADQKLLALLKRNLS